MHNRMRKMVKSISVLLVILLFVTSGVPRNFMPGFLPEGLMLNTAQASTVTTYTLSMAKDQIGYFDGYNTVYAEGTIKVTIDSSSNRVTLSGVSGTYTLKKGGETKTSSMTTSTTPYIEVNGVKITTSGVTLNDNKLDSLAEEIAKDKVQTNVNFDLGYNFSNPFGGSAIEGDAVTKARLDSYTEGGGGGSGGSCIPASYSSSATTYTLEAIDDINGTSGSRNSMGKITIHINEANNTVTVKSIDSSIKDYILERAQRTDSTARVTVTGVELSNREALLGTPKVLSNGYLEDFMENVNRGNVGDSFEDYITYTQSSSNSSLVYDMSFITIFKLISYTPDTIPQSGNCGGGTPPPPPPPPPPPVQTPVPSEGTCPEGTTKVGSGSSAYCERTNTETITETIVETIVETVTVTEYVKQTQKEFINMGDYIGLDVILESLNQGYGSSGDRKDGSFDQDKGNHSTGWTLDESGNPFESDFIKYTNIPDNGQINTLDSFWQPEALVTQGNKSFDVPEKDTNTQAESQKWKENLDAFKSSLSVVELITYQVTDLDKFDNLIKDKGIQGLFEKSNNGAYVHKDNILSATVNKSGINNYENLKIDESGYYIIASKYVNQPAIDKEGGAKPSKEIINKHTIYNFTPVSINFMNDLGYLPIYNNLLTQVNETMLLTGNKKGNHKLPNLMYQTYSSMKIPSAYNYANSKALVASTNGGIQLVDSKLKELSIVNNSGFSNLANVKFTDIVEYGNGFFVSCSQGILYLDAKTNTLTSTNIQTAISDIALNNDVMYALTDTEILSFFIDGSNLIESNNKISLAGKLTKGSGKAGRIEIVGDLLSVSTKDEGSGSEVLILGKL